MFVTVFLFNRILKDRNHLKFTIMKRIVLTFTFVLFISVLANSKENENVIPLIGSIAPSFTANSTQGKINFPEDFGKKWKILFCHPGDFTPVCTTELLEMAYLSPEFKKLGVKIAAVSIDKLETHQNWVLWLEDAEYKNRGKLKITFPLIEDQNGLVAKKYGMVHLPESSSRDVRGVYIIDPNNIIRSVIFYPMEIGRNMDEIIRSPQALQIHDELRVYTPVNWQAGDDVIVPFRPFPLAELELNPDKINREYYSIKNHVWFKRSKSQVVEK